MNSARMAAASDDAMLSTDLADYLTRQGVPFRESHHLVGRAVRRAEKLGVSLRDLDPAEYQAIHPAFTEDVYAVFDFQRSVGARHRTRYVSRSNVPESILKPIDKEEIA